MAGGNKYACKNRSTTDGKAQGGWERLLRLRGLSIRDGVVTNRRIKHKYVRTQIISGHGVHYNQYDIGSGLGGAYVTYSGASVSECRVAAAAHSHFPFHALYLLHP